MKEIPVWWVVENTGTLNKKVICLYCYRDGTGIIKMKNKKEIKKHFMNHIDILFSELL